VDDDEESGATAVTSYMHTKNEIVETDVIVPSVSEIGPEENLEKVGEVLNIVGNVVIVKGLPADPCKAASEKALDTETLLVFDDRKVLGHVRVLAIFKTPVLKTSCRYMKRLGLHPNPCTR